ncbi:penicillin-binding transpeptidase domain-containing protein [Kocuria sp. cx-455]|uniref:penicillin-binding transpeptidase domain-containing protein n=1 Tax=Kocuria sp. cx-455 TaxID=2771377 RepID=UPI003D732835
MNSTNRRTFLTWSGLGLACVSAGMLTSCSVGRSESPRDVAGRLATSLHQGDVAGVPLVSAPSDTQSFLAERMKGSQRPAVDVRGIDERDGAATARLGFTWPSTDPEQAWTYETQAQLEKVDGQWRVRWEDSILHPDLAEGQGLALATIPGERAQILDRNGAALVSDQQVHLPGINKQGLTDDQAAASARKLAAVLDIDPKDYQEKVAAYGPQAFVDALTLRRSDFLELDAAALKTITGYEVLTNTMPLSLQRGFASAVLGSVRPPTAEDVENRGDEIKDAEWIGAGGLQEAFDEKLRAAPSVRVTIRELDGSAPPVSTGPLWEQKAPAKSPLTTTLDADLQKAAEGIIKDTGSPSAIVAVRPSTGDILAVASGPDDNSYPTATVGQYAPGSTFKIATSLALLRHGASPDSAVQCSESITVDGQTFKNAGTYLPDHLGDISLREAIAQSCNTALIDKHDSVSQSDLVSAGEALGIGADWDLGISAYSGNIPHDEAGTEHAASMIGQGRIQTSPLAMAVFAASVVRGRCVCPQLVPEEKPARELPTTLTEQEAAQLKELMRAVVTEGHLEQLNNHPGGDVLGKTGTAEFGQPDPDRGGFPRTHSWVIVAQGDLAFSVFVEDGDYGSVTGAPLAKEFLDAAYEVLSPPPA